MLSFIQNNPDWKSKSFHYIDTSLIKPNPNQPRRHFDEYEMDKLTESIRKNGLIQPIIVQRDADCYRLIAGERRLRASRLAGLRNIPCIVQRTEYADSAILALVENLQRSDLNVFEEAEAIAQIITNTGVSQQDAAERLGMAQSTLSNKLRLLRLNDDERARIFAARLTERHARALVRIDDKPVRAQALDIIIAKEMNVHDTENYISELLMPTKPDAPEKPRRVVVVRDVRLFFNSMSKMVSCMREAGFNAKTNKKETEEYIEYTVIIPKNCKTP